MPRAQPPLHSNDVALQPTTLSGVLLLPVSSSKASFPVSSVASAVRLPMSGPLRGNRDCLRHNRQSHQEGKETTQHAVKNDLPDFFLYPCLFLTGFGSLGVRVVT